MISRFLIFTDLDGTLIDFETYSAAVARPAVQSLSAAGVPVIFCSSKTFAEQQSLQEEFGIRMPCIVENGSAIVAPATYWRKPPAGAEERDGWSWNTLGTRAAEIRRQICKIECEIGESLRGFSSMATEDVASLTGLDLVSARRAQSRDFSETLAEARPEAFWKEIEPLFAKRGLVCMGGGRFHTVVSSSCDKGRAVKEFVRILSEDTGRDDFLAVGIGDSPNDHELLAATDVAYQVKRPDGLWSELGIEDVVKVNEIGPKGWVSAIGGLLRSQGIAVNAVY